MKFILILLGIEHTGHHFWNSEYKKGLLQNLNTTVFLKKLAGVNFNYEMQNSVKREHGTIGEYSIMLNEYKDAIKEDLYSDGQIGYISATSYPGGSYKSCSTYYKECVYPLPVAIYKAASSFDITVKFLLLMRRPIDTVTDYFWPNSGFVDIRLENMINACYKLQHDLFRLKKSSVLCVDYESYYNETVQYSISNFMETYVGDTIKRLYKPRPLKTLQSYSYFSNMDNKTKIKYNIYEKCMINIKNIWC